MNVHLTSELERIVQRKVKTGRYNSASEVMREALRLMEERDQLLKFRKDELSRKIAAGLDALRRGEGVDGEEFFEQLESREAILGQREPAKPAKQPKGTARRKTA